MENIEGIEYLEDGHVKINPGIGFIKDLDTLAPTFEVFEDFEIKRYRDYVKAVAGPFWYEWDPTGAIVLSKGCIGRCSFCNSRIVDQGKYRTFSEENTLMQLKTIYELYQPKNFKIYDALFGANKRQFRVVCNFMREFQIPWCFGTRVDLLKTEDIELLKGTCVKDIFFGLKSVNLDTLKFNGKISYKKTDEYLTAAVKVLKELMDADLTCFIALLFALPNEKTTMYEDTIKFFKENNLIGEKLMVAPSTPIAFQGTLLWDLIPPDQRCYDWEKYNINPENFLREPKIFYINPDFTIEELFNHMVSSTDDLFKISDLTENDLFLMDLKSIINEGYEAIESEMDKEWFKLSIDFTAKKYLASK